MPQKPALDDIKNIIAVRNDRLGEFMLTLPAIAALRSRFPLARITLVCGSSLSELARYIEVADNIIIWDSFKKHSLKEKMGLIQSIKSRKCDLCIIFNPSREFNIVSFLSGIPIRIGYDRKWGFLLTHKIPDTKHLAVKHEIEYNLDLLKTVGIEAAGEDRFSFKIGHIAVDRDLIVIHPWTSDPIKQWPLDNFKALALKITDELGKKVIIVGGKEEGSYYGGIFTGFNDKITDLTAKTSLIDLARILKGASLLVSADSGPVHLACSLGTPVLALFRNDIPGKTATRWGPRGKDNLVIEKSNLCDITVEQVFDNIKRMLKI